MFESIVLGAIQGIAEWIPISSEAAIIFAKNTFFGGGFSLESLVKMALFLHLGTFFAALMYFRKEVKEILVGLFNFKNTSLENKKAITFLVISTLISGALGFLVLKTASNFEANLELGSKFINILIALLLVITAFLQIKALKQKDQSELKSISDLRPVDGIILGLAQAFAVLPGLSRSGLTVSALLMRKFNDTLSLKLSFLMSLPIVLLGNIVLNFQHLNLSTVSIAGFLSAFIFGFITISLLLKFSQKINFAYFTLFFAALVFISVFL